MNKIVPQLILALASFSSIGETIALPSGQYTGQAKFISNMLGESNPLLASYQSTDNGFIFASVAGNEHEVATYKLTKTGTGFFEIEIDLEIKTEHSTQTTTGTGSGYCKENFCILNYEFLLEQNQLPGVKSVTVSDVLDFTTENEMIRSAFLKWIPSDPNDYPDTMFYKGTLQANN